MQAKTYKKNRGFTLVETLIAISILILAVTGAFAAAQNGISSAIFSKDQIIAFYLAQEGVEYVRNVRDQNGLQGLPWLRGVAEAGDPCEIGSKCRVDAVAASGNLVRCPITGCPNVKLNGSGFYAHDSGTDTQFNREIILSEVVPNKEVAITVKVTWSKGLVNRKFEARENIFNWQ